VDLNLGLFCHSNQFCGHRTHATDRHPPLSAAVADHVIQKTAVLPQGRIVCRCEGADQCICEHQATYGVVAECRLDELAQRLLDHSSP
jgi:hypothetical protein